MSPLVYTLRCHQWLIDDGVCVARGRRPANRTGRSQP
jgi:hypothetical protein